MRISANEGDPGYVTPAAAGRLRVFLDDVEQKAVITADEEQDFVHRYKLDADGKCVIASDGASLETEERRGAVRIEAAP